MTKYLLLIALMLFSAEAASAQFVSLAERPGMKCGAAIEGLRMCVPATELNFKQGAPIQIDFFLENTTDKDIEVRERGGGFANNYLIRVETPAGGILRSKLELGTLKVARESCQPKPVAPSDIRDLPINGGPHYTGLPAKAAMTGYFDLAQYYDLSAKGRYTLMLARIERLLDGTEAKTDPTKPPLIVIGGYRNKKVMLQLPTIEISVE